MHTRFSFTLTCLAIFGLTGCDFPIGGPMEEEEYTAPAELLVQGYTDSELRVTLKNEVYILTEINESFADGMADLTARSLTGSVPYHSASLQFPADVVSDTSYFFGDLGGNVGLTGVTSLVFTEYVDALQFAMESGHVFSFANLANAQSMDETNLTVTFSFFDENFDLLVTAQGSIRDETDAIVEENVPISLLWQFR